ncbi:hypothetical protein E2C01_051162 [Portunus trituberculatus]|uniref:Uncharacterized protein n=1 Tax=Portunus trituberculatus TaxID=210409 RepID=A0A5B7GIU2_PORTR|nr:hypothetical protein [Portunus trituberculatus]
MPEKRDLATPWSSMSRNKGMGSSEGRGGGGRGRAGEVRAAGSDDLFTPREPPYSQARDLATRWPLLLLLLLLLRFLLRLLLLPHPLSLSGKTYHDI